MTVVSKLAAAVVCVGAAAALTAVVADARPAPQPVAGEPVLTAGHVRSALESVHTGAVAPLAGALGGRECALWEVLREALDPAPLAAALPCPPPPA